MTLLKNRLSIFILSLLVILCGFFCIPHTVEAAPPKYDENLTPHLFEKHFVLDPGSLGVSKDKTLAQNISRMFYPRGVQEWATDSRIYVVIRDMTLWVMIIFFVRAWASLLLNKKPEESKKHLYSLLYIMLGWVLVYASNWLFWTVFNFDAGGFTDDGEWLGWFTNSLIWKVAFFILSAIKAIAFFLAIIMTAVTWFKVIAAWEWEKWKKLVKWLINVVVALLVIKWVDFIYYLAADSSNFVQNASDFIINVAKVFGRIYWIVTFIMVIVAWYLYITDWWTWSNFKKATNVLINIVLSGLVLFSFLLITYQIFAEFQKWWDAVSMLNLTKFYV